MCPEDGVSGDGVDIDIGDEGEPPGPYVFLPLFADDVGSRFGRDARVEYTSRKPACVDWSSPEELFLRVGNSGGVISDLICIEYDIVYCTASVHGPADGFTVSHAAEQASDPLEKYTTLNYVPPRGTIQIRIAIPAPFGNEFVGVSNLYFRARATTIWASGLPRAQWDFLADPAVTEAVLRLAPP